MCSAMGTCFSVPKLITGLMKNTIQVYWRVVDGLWDSNVFCVGTSVVREWLREGEKLTIKLQILLPNDLYTKAQDSLVKGRMEFPQLMEKSIWSSLVHRCY